MTDLEKPTTIEFDLTDHVATVTLNRPDKLNSFNKTMADELCAAWARVRDDEDIHVAVLRANGDRAFCTASMSARDAGGSLNRSSTRKILVRSWVPRRIACGSR